ncbi:hypothetical protein ACFVWY_10705 [Streptomyces sp. NPDC058195]|uniref:hypothetical protein n=1 Tax=Streptomyces sp. NPDC058195 TaxID=3346375 RepID=UPI0036E52C66
MDRGRTRAPGASRLFVLCAVLWGLFLMHGAPASAVEGCHDARAMTAAAPDAAATGGHAAMAEGDGAERVAAAAPGTSGESCVFTQSRDRLLPLLMALGLVVPAAVVLAGRRTAVRGPGRRGPPFSGRGLLLQVCVART